MFLIRPVIALIAVFRAVPGGLRGSIPRDAHVAVRIRRQTSDRGLSESMLRRLGVAESSPSNSKVPYRTYRRAER
jgi:hypothetical protein